MTSFTDIKSAFMAKGRKMDHSYWCYFRKTKGCPWVELFYSYLRKGMHNKHAALLRFVALLFCDNRYFVILFMWRLKPPRTSPKSRLNKKYKCWHLLLKECQPFVPLVWYGQSWISRSMQSKAAQEFLKFLESNNVCQRFRMDRLRP